MQYTSNMHRSSPKSKLVAVIILNWNNYEDTSQCLESVLKSDTHGFWLEVIVVDNGSTDGSCDRLEVDYPSVTFIRSGENYGFARGNNSGIKHARRRGADYVLLLNQAVILSIRYIRTRLDFFEANTYA